MNYLIIYFFTQLVYSSLRFNSKMEKYDFLGALTAFILTLILISIINGISGWLKIFNSDSSISFNYIVLFFCFLILMVDFILFKFLKSTKNVQK
jgi:hypothetical protein